MSEQQALKVHREKETRQNVEELLSHLEFADIDDFNNMVTNEFIEVNFFDGEDEK